MTVPAFTLVIPAYNEESYLPRLLDSVRAARDRFHRGPQAVQVVVADNDSTDATAEIARAYGCEVVHESKRIIGAVRNAGARVARGELLAFIDADSQIHPETFGTIERTMTTRRFVGGATGVRLERASLGLAVTWMLMMPMVWLTRMDTGVVFCRRRDFETIGGYTEQWLYAEDVRFLFDLRRLGRQRGQKLTRATAAKAVTSTRKFDKHGQWHYFSILGKFLYWQLFSRESMDRFARSYWYDDR